MNPGQVWGCNPCGTRWAVASPVCWSCGRPGEPVDRPHISGGGCTPSGMFTEIDRARREGPTLADDPCGGGPL